MSDDRIDLDDREQAAKDQEAAEGSDPPGDAGRQGRTEPREASAAASATDGAGTGPGRPAGSPSGELGPHDIKVGAKDQGGKQVTWVYWSTRDYAVYQWSRQVPNDGLSGRLVSWFTKSPTMRTEYGISPHFGRDDQRLKYALIHRDLSVIYGLQQGRLACRESINREIARAIMLALEDRPEDAQSILSHLKTRMMRMRNIEGRASYLGACMSFMLLALIVLAVISTAGEEAWIASTIVPLLGPELLLLKVIVCGALGAFLSVCLSIEKLEIDPETPRKVNRISGITRLVIGMSAGLVVYLAIGAGLVLSEGLKPEVGEDGELSARVTAGILLLAVVAGFSEVFVPNILRRVGGENESSGAPARGAGNGAARQEVGGS